MTKTLIGKEGEKNRKSTECQWEIQGGIWGTALV